MIDREVIEHLVEFLCYQGMYQDFISYMKNKGYDVVEDENSTYITIKE